MIVLASIKLVYNTTYSFFVFIITYLESEPRTAIYICIDSTCWVNISTAESIANDFSVNVCVLLLHTYSIHSVKIVYLTRRKVSQY